MDDAARAISYNVRRDTPQDGEYDWDRRRDAVVSTLAFHRPDAIGLQEPLAHQFDDVREGLPGFEWVGESRLAGEGEGEFCPVGYRTDRFERLDADTFWLSEAPGEAGSLGWDASHPRIATWARLRDRRTGERLLFAATHLDHEGERARREGARLLRDRLADVRDGDPVLLVGDCNATPEEEPYRILAGEGEFESPLTDARAASERPPHGPDTTLTDYESLTPGARIDHAFVADLTVRQCGTAADAFGDGWYPSDHLPIVVDFAP